MKKNLFLALVVFLLTGSVKAQRLDITLTDNSTVSYELAKIKYMEIFQNGEPGQLSGHWYLGYRKSSSGTTHYDGTEHLLFNGNRLKWETANGETNYTLTYADDLLSFKAVEDGKTVPITYTIFAAEDDVLILKRSSVFTYYFYKSREAAHSAEMETSYPTTHNETNDINKILSYKGGSSYSSITPMGKHFEKFLTPVSSDKIAWLQDPTKQPAFTVGDSKYWTTKNVNLYPFGDPQPADVNQHAIGNCCMCAVLASMAYLYPDYIKHIITQPTSTTYKVAMFDPKGQPIDVLVDNKFLCNARGDLAQLTGKNNAVTWATILEKALMKWEEVYQCNGIEGIGTEHAAPPFTGEGNSFSISPGTLFNKEMQKVVDYAMRNGMISIGGFNKGDLLCGTLTSVTGHAFTLMYTNKPDQYLWSMRNPWGITEVDGVLEIPNKREIVKTIDFRIVYPGAAKPYLRADIAGYNVPKFAPRKGDLGVSKRLLKMVGLESYGPEQVIDGEEEEE